MALFLSAVLLLAVSGTAVNAQGEYKECSQDTLRDCRRTIEDVLMGSGEARTLELEDQCWRIRQNFDCVQWQSSMCLKKHEQDENADIIRKSWRFLEGYCENFKNYWTKSCYQTDRLKQCENLLPYRSRSVDPEACRSYFSFRECAMSAIKSDCNSDDQRLLGVYLMDKGRQKSWNCPKSTEPVLERLSAGDAGADSEEEVMHADSALSFGTCAYDAAQELGEKCPKKFQDLKLSPQEAADEKMRKEKACCAFVEYENCVMNLLQEKCGDKGRRESETVISVAKSALKINCDDYDASTCSSAPYITVFNAWLVLALVVSFIVSSFSVHAV